MPRTLSSIPSITHTPTAFNGTRAPTTGVTAVVHTTLTSTPDRSPTPTKTWTTTALPANTRTPTRTLTPSRTAVGAATSTPSITPRKTITQTFAPSNTPTKTPTNFTPSPTITPTATTTGGIPVTQTWNFYYYAGSERVAMRVYKPNSQNDVYYLFSDHLGSTSEVRTADGTLHSRQWYKVFGEMRYQPVGWVWP